MITQLSLHLNQMMNLRESSVLALWNEEPESMYPLIKIKLSLLSVQQHIAMIYHPEQR